MVDEIKLIYLMDPHCGWCHGYSDTIREFYDSTIEDSAIVLTVVPGGLFIPARKISPEFIDGKRPIAKRISDIFGVEFSPSYFDDVLGEDFLLDSTPPCRGVCAANLIDPSKSVVFSLALGRAAFLHGRNISKLDIVVAVAAEQGYEPEEFREVMDSEAATEALNRSLDFAHRAATGFPSLFLERNGEIEHLGGAELTVQALQNHIADST